MNGPRQVIWNRVPCMDMATLRQLKMFLTNEIKKHGEDNYGYFVFNQIFINIIKKIILFRRK